MLKSASFSFRRNVSGITPSNACGRLTLLGYPTRKPDHRLVQRNIFFTVFFVRPYVQDDMPIGHVRQLRPTYIWNSNDVFKVNALCLEFTQCITGISSAPWTAIYYCTFIAAAAAATFIKTAKLFHAHSFCNCQTSYKIHKGSGQLSVSEM